MTTDNDRDTGASRTPAARTGLDANRRHCEPRLSGVGAAGAPAPERATRRATIEGEP